MIILRSISGQLSAFFASSSVVQLSLKRLPYCAGTIRIVARLALVGATLAMSLPTGAESVTAVDKGAPTENTEQHLLPDRSYQQWFQNQFQDTLDGDKIEIKKVLEQQANTVKLENVVAPIHFSSGEAEIPENYVALIRDVLESMKDRVNVRLHFIGHTDNVPLTGAAKEKYGDNVGLSQERAGTTAEYFQRALNLPPEAISFDGLGESKPIAGNNSEAGKAENRRVEVQVWYDEISEKLVDKEVQINQDLKRIKVCRIETVCKLRYQEGHSRRARLKNLVPPLRYVEGMVEMPVSFIQQLNEAMYNLRQKSKVQIKLIGYTDNMPLTGLNARIYGDHLGLSKARARRVALAVQEALNLPNTAIDSDGRGLTAPIASNESELGRAMNRRIEVEFWHDDPLEQLSDEPQLCPETAAAETVTRVYDPPAGNVKPVYFDNGQPAIPSGYVGRLKRIMDEVSDKGNVRVRFIGYTNNERMDRRSAMVYGDDIGLSTARARRVMEIIKEQGGIDDRQLEFEGKGFLHSDDVVNAGFLQFDDSRVEAQVVYDDLAMLDDQEGLQIERITREVALQNPFALNLMRISVDGEPVDDPGKSVADVQRCTDVALDQAQFEFKFDNLAFKPRLNVTVWPNVISYRDDMSTGFPENLATFRSYSNYPSFIQRSEIRLFDNNTSTRDTPIEIIPLDDNGNAEWMAKFEQYQAPGIELNYVLRVYDDDGRFDETAPQTLWLIDRLEDLPRDSNIEDELLAGYGENRLGLNTIELNGGTVKVLGKGIPAGHSVWFAGNTVPVSDQGEFISEMLIPPGLHTVEIAVLDEAGNGELYLRDLELEKNDWFYIGMADVTASQDSTNGPAALITGDQTHYDNDLSIDGRLAFYTNGRFLNNWGLTASADTLEGPIDEIFSNFMDKSPDSVFRRIDPDYYYPTFGDDSTMEEMAPTMGKFYVNLKKDQNHGLWGNFNIDYTGNSLAHVDRSLYGANLHYASDAITEFGEKNLTADVFSAEPGTIAGRDEFRGTGGSLYFLRHQDILTGSERARIEVRNPVSGIVLQVKNLTPALDYDVDYIQGRVMLSDPLSASLGDNLAVDNGRGGNEIHLVIRYEYTPGFDDLNNLANGGRVDYWFNDWLKLGATASDFSDDVNKNSLIAGDITLRKTAGTWLKLGQANSEGINSDALLSNDGGFNFNSITQPMDGNVSAGASQIDASLRFEDVFDGVKGKATLYSQQLDAGYSAPGLSALTETTQSGGSVDYQVINSLDVKLKADKKTQESALDIAAYELDVDYGLTESWQLITGFRMDERIDHSTIVPLTQKQGKRTDMALRAEYDSKQRWSAYGYLQGTIKTTGNREENGRTGFGGEYRATDRLKLNGEVSAGDLGTAEKIGTEYLLSERTNLYLNYTLDNERADNGTQARKGNMSSGFKTRYSDSASIYVEERYAHGDVPTGLMHSVGIDLAATDRLSFGATIDVGTLQDNTTGATMERQAYGFKIGYGVDGFKYNGAIEHRVDNMQNPDTTVSERVTSLFKNNVQYQVNDDWRWIGKLNHSTSDSGLGEFYNGNFTEAVIGSGYRPVNNDNLNALFKYTYFYNMPTADQVTLNNTAVEYIQKSQIISVDLTYDLTRRWTLGGKYAHRFGQLSLDRVDPVFFQSNADLVIVRADWKFAERWEALLEGRTLDLPNAGDTRSGALLVVYRHIGDHLKLGTGYNFTDFSDDLTDLDFDSQGFFINLVGKM